MPKIQIFKILALSLIIQLDVLCQNEQLKGIDNIYVRFNKIRYKLSFGALSQSKFLKNLYGNIKKNDKEKKIYIRDLSSVPDVINSLETVYKNKNLQKDKLIDLILEKHFQDTSNSDLNDALKFAKKIDAPVVYDALIEKYLILLINQPEIGAGYLDELPNGIKQQILNQYKRKFNKSFRIFKIELPTTRME